MGWNGWLMTTPIGMGDISTAVGNSSLDLGTLVANGTINKWALHKPVMLLTGYDTPTDIYPNDSTWLSYMQNYVRETASNTLCPFALKVTPSVNLYEVIGQVANAAVDWVYQQPPASGTFWRRMLDFKNYTINPNVPMNAPADMTYYKDSTNILSLDTNDGEAGNTSIQVSQLSTLSSYKLMLAVKASSSLWYYCVMNTVISQSVSAGTIDFTLPGSLGLSAGTYNAYLVGLTSSWTGTTNTWITGSDSLMRSFGYNMLPLPFESKTKCGFLFKVASTAPTNIAYISFVLYVNVDYTIQKILFEMEKYGSITDISSFSLSLTNLVVHDDNETQTWNINNSATFNGSNCVNGSSKATGAVELDVASYNINAGDYPNITFTSQNNRSYQVTGSGEGPTNIIFV